MYLITRSNYPESEDDTPLKLVATEAEVFPYVKNAPQPEGYGYFKVYQSAPDGTLQYLYGLEDWTHQYYSDDYKGERQPKAWIKSLGESGLVREIVE